MTTYLVSGATGFLGRHFMERLLARDDVDAVYVPVRQPFQGRLAYLARGWTRGERVRPLAGDLLQPCLGLEEATLDELTGQVDHVVHLATRYDPAANRQLNRAAIVEGTGHLLQLVRRIRAGRLHHLSSVAVAGDARGRFGEEMFDVGQRLPSPCQRTAFAAEQLVRGQHDAPWRIYRSAAVAGHSVTGATDAAEGLYHLFPVIRRLTALPGLPVLLVPDLGATCVVPVDYVAAALDHLVHAPGLDGQTFHLVAPRPQPLHEVYDALARAAGAPRVAWGLDRRLAAPVRAASRLGNRLPGAELAGHLALSRLGIPPETLACLTFSATFDDAATRQALAGTGIAAPAFEDYAPALWRYWKDNLDPGRSRRAGPRGPLAGRRVVITGSAAGIGRATALEVAAAGGVPLLVDRRAEELGKVKAEIEAAGGVAYAYPADLTDAGSVEDLVERMLADHPGIDMLVNNAGRSIRRSLRLTFGRFHDFERTMAVNYFGAVRLTMALLPHMIERRSGHIVNISSIGAQVNPPRFSAYVASKAALDAFSRVAAAEMYGDGVTFTTVHMPLVRTAMTAPTKLYDTFPVKQTMLSPDQAAKLVLRALTERPKEISTPVGTLGQLVYALTPGVVDLLLHEAYQAFPDSAAARGVSAEAGRAEAAPGRGGHAAPGRGAQVLTKAATAAREQPLSRAAVAMMRLLPGIHW